MAQWLRALVALPEEPGEQSTSTETHSTFKNTVISLQLEVEFDETTAYHRKVKSLEYACVGAK